MAIIDIFYYLFEADARKLKAALKDATRQSQEAGKALSDVDRRAIQLGSSIKDFLSNLARLYIGTAAISSFKAVTEEVAAQNVELDRQARAIGMNVERFQQWKGAFESVGSSGEAFTGLFQRLRTMTRDPEAAINRIAQSMHRMSDTQRRMYGRHLGIDQATIDLLAKGKKGIDELMAKEKALGIATKADIEQSKKFAVALRDLKRLFDDIKQKTVSAVMPAFQSMLEGMQKFIGFMREHQPFVAAFFIGMAAVITTMYLPAVIKAVAATFMWLAPFLAIGAAVAVIALIVDDIITYFQGGDSMLGRWAKKFPTLEKALQGIKTFLAAIGELFDQNVIPAAEAFGEIVSGVLDWIKEKFVSLFEVAVLPFKALMKLGEIFADLITGRIDGVRAAFASLWEYVKGIIGWIDEKLEAAANAIVGIFGGGDDEEVTVEKTTLEKNMAAGQAIVGQAANPALAAQGAPGRGGNVHNEKNVQIGAVTVNTQATDAAGIARDLDSALSHQLRGAQEQFDNGVAM
ncbi:MAG: hypothetical protein LBP58_06920 [Azoarcus sp.]|jgi:ASC-1-like (ASCH) protein|nr:hypothetical protein [Azoarcus sp.]